MQSATQPLNVDRLRAMRTAILQHFTTMASIHPKVAHLLSLPQPAQRSEEWYAARYQRLTASDAATALGENPYETRDQLILKKCGYGPKFTGNQATAHGQQWESHVSDLFCKKTGFKAYDAGLLLHPTIPFLGGSPDGLLSSEDGGKCALLEIKCPLYRAIKDEVPAHYKAQILLCMEVCDVDSCWFVQFKPESLLNDEVYSAIEVHRDRDWFAKSLPVFEAFWKEVVHCRTHGVADVLARIESKKRPRAAPKKETRVAMVDEEDEETCLIKPRKKAAAKRVEACEQDEKTRDESDEETCLITPRSKGGDDRVKDNGKNDEEECLIMPRPKRQLDSKEEACMIAPLPKRYREEDKCIIRPSAAKKLPKKSGDIFDTCIIVPR